MNRLETDVFHRFLAQPEVITAEGIIKTTDYNGSIIDCYCRLLKVLIATGAHSVYAIYMMRSLGEETDAEPDFDARSDYKFVAYCVDGEKLYSDSDKLKVAFDMDADPIDKEHVATIWGNYLRTIVEPNPGKVLNSKQIDLAANFAIREFVFDEPIDCVAQGIMEKYDITDAGYKNYLANPETWAATNTRELDESWLKDKGIAFTDSFVKVLISLEYLYKKQVEFSRLKPVDSFWRWYKELATAVKPHIMESIDIELEAGGKTFIVPYSADKLFSEANVRNKSLPIEYADVGIEKALMYFLMQSGTSDGSFIPLSMLTRISYGDSVLWENKKHLNWKYGDGKCG